MDRFDTFLQELNSTLRLPILVAPMFLISGPDLVVSAAKAGVIAAFPAPNARTIDDLKDWMTRISTGLSKIQRPGQWALNMIVHPTYDRFEAELNLVSEYKPKIVISALGGPKRILNRVHEYGGKVFSDVISSEQARKAIDAGADGIVAVCSGAGGHTGSISPLALIQEIRTFWSGPLIAGGAVSSAKCVAAMLLLGADYAYMGTRFISAKESLVNDEYRHMLLRANASDIVTTAAVSGVPGNWLRESLEHNKIDPESLSSTVKVDFSDIHGEAKAWKNVWGAGHGVGASRDIETVEDIINGLVGDWHEVISTCAQFSAWPRSAPLASNSVPGLH